MNENLKKFLKALSDLSNEYGLLIGGCGCCASPYIDIITTQENVGVLLTYNHDTKEYEVTL